MHQGRGRLSESSPRRRSDVSPRALTQLSQASPRQDPKKDNSARPSTYYSPERRKSASARPRQLPQPGEVSRRKSAAARLTYRTPPTPQSSSSSSGRSPSRAVVENADSQLRSQMRKDSSPGRTGARGDLSPSRRSDDGEEYRTPPDRSPNLSRQQDFHKTDRSPTTYYQSDKSPNRENVSRTPPDRSPNRTTVYHRSPVDSGRRSPRDGEDHRREGSDGLRRKDTSPGRSTTTDSKESSPMTLHPNDQPTSNPNYPPGATQVGRRRSSSGQRLERQAAVVRERIAMHPDEISLGSDSQKQGTIFSFLLF